MNKQDLLNVLADIFIPLGFKKKGNYLVKNEQSINTILHLQKSQFSESFYLNYGYIMNSIPLDGLTMHVSSGLGSSNALENQKIKEMLNLENRMTDSEREHGFRKVILDNLVPKIESINSEEDIFNDLKKRSTLNDIPLIVKEHFGL